MNLAPIILFVYNRPWHTEQTVSALEKNRYADQSDLFIYADGPKKGESDSEIKKVREYIRTISGFKSVTITERNQNMGLADSTIKGVTEVINQLGKVIVLEDDLELSHDFLRFMNESLDRYSNDDRVMQISGHMFNTPIEAETDAVFLPFTNSIGWATWQRAWDYRDPSMAGYQKLKKSKSLRMRFNLDGAYDFFGLIESQMNGKLESWAIQWYLDVFMANGMVLYPINSLVKHIGFGAEATHCRDIDFSGIYATSCVEINHQHLNFPDVTINQDVYQKVKFLLSSKPTMVDRLKKKLKILLENRDF